MATVLVVDSERAVAEALEALLRDAGHTVHLAANGQAGLRALVRLQAGPGVHAVFMNCRMPVMDGVAALQAMQKDPALAVVPVVLMSALSEASIRSQVGGYAGFLRKPFRVQTVLAVLNMVLQG